MMYSDWYEKIDDIVAMIKGDGLCVPTYHVQKGIGEKISIGTSEELEEAFKNYRINAEMAAFHEQLDELYREENAFLMAY